MLLCLSQTPGWSNKEVNDQWVGRRGIGRDARQNKKKKEEREKDERRMLGTAIQSHSQTPNKKEKNTDIEKIKTQRQKVDG